MQNTFATVLMTADLDHLADQVVEAMGIPRFFHGSAKRLIIEPLETVLKFVSPDIVEVLISAIDGLTEAEAAKFADVITEEVVEFSRLLPDSLERPMYHAIVVALLSYATSDKPLTLVRAPGGDA
jgi:hypothetical protein